MKKKRTKVMSERLGKIAELGCLVCSDIGYPDTPAEIHHQLGQGRDDNKCIPLRPTHHRFGKFGRAVHNGTKTFESFYGTQAEMVQRVNKLVDVVS